MTTNENFRTVLEIVDLAIDLERPDLNMTDMMQSQLAILDIRPPTVDEFDAMHWVSQRLQSDGGAGYVDGVTGQRVDIAAAERYAQLSNPESWLLSDADRANAIIIANMPPEDTSFDAFYAYTEDPESVLAYRKALQDQGDATEPEIVAGYISYQSGLLALDTALKRRAHFRDNAAGLIALEMTWQDDVDETAEGKVIDQAAEDKRQQEYSARLDASLEEWQAAHPPMTAKEKAVLHARFSAVQRPDQPC